MEAGPLVVEYLAMSLQVNLRVNLQVDSFLLLEQVRVEAEYVSILYFGVSVMRTITLAIGGVP